MSLNVDALQIAACDSFRSVWAAAASLRGPARRSFFKSAGYRCRREALSPTLVCWTFWTLSRCDTAEDWARARDGTAVLQRDGAPPRFVFAPTQCLDEASALAPGDLIDGLLGRGWELRWVDKFASVRVLVWSDPTGRLRVTTRRDQEAVETLTLSLLLPQHRRAVRDAPLWFDLCPLRPGRALRYLATSASGGGCYRDPALAGCEDEPLIELACPVGVPWTRSRDKALFLLGAHLAAEGAEGVMLEAQRGYRGYRVFQVAFCRDPRRPRPRGSDGQLRSLQEKLLRGEAAPADLEPSPARSEAQDLSRGLGRIAQLVGRAKLPLRLSLGAVRAAPPSGRRAALARYARDVRISCLPPWVQRYLFAAGRDPAAPAPDLEDPLAFLVRLLLAPVRGRPLLRRLQARSLAWHQARPWEPVRLPRPSHRAGSVVCVDYEAALGSCAPGFDSTRVGRVVETYQRAGFLTVLLLVAQEDPLVHTRVWAATGLVFDLTVTAQDEAARAAAVGKYAEPGGLVVHLGAEAALRRSRAAVGHLARYVPVVVGGPGPWRPPAPAPGRALLVAVLAGAGDAAGALERVRAMAEARGRHVTVHWRGGTLVAAAVARGDVVLFCNAPTSTEWFQLVLRHRAVADMVILGYVPSAPDDPRRVLPAYDAWTAARLARPLVPASMSRTQARMANAAHLQQMLLHPGRVTRVAPPPVGFWEPVEVARHVWEHVEPLLSGSAPRPPATFSLGVPLPTSVPLPPPVAPRGSPRSAIPVPRLVAVPRVTLAPVVAPADAAAYAAMGLSLRVTLGEEPLDDARACVLPAQLRTVDEAAVGPPPERPHVTLAHYGPVGGEAAEQLLAAAGHRWDRPMACAYGESFIACAVPLTCFY